MNIGLSSIALSNYIHLNLAYYSQSTPLSPCNHKNINCRSDWRDQGRIEQGTPTPGHLWMWKNCTDIYCEKNMLKFENFWKCTPEMYLFRFLNTPLGGGGRQHRCLPRAANTLAPPLLPCWKCDVISSRLSNSVNRREFTWGTTGPIFILIWFNWNDGALRFPNKNNNSKISSDHNQFVVQKC